MGSKTPLSYTDYFYIDTIFNNIKYEYMFSKGEKAPTLDLLNESETTSCNGTEIKIYIKNTNDRTKFKNELLSQLCYFDNVYFNNWGIDNNYKIYETKTFKYRNQDQYNNELHIILGKVSYGVNWEELNLKVIKVPIGLKFEIGDFQVTPNRESIRYTDETKILIREKINKAVEELKGLYHDDTMLYNNYLDYLDNKDGRPYILFGDEDKLYLTGLKEQKAVFKPFYELGIDSEMLSHLMNNLYNCLGKIDSVERISERNINSIYSHFINNTNIILSNNKQFTNIKNLKFIHNRIFIQKKINKDLIEKIGKFIIKERVDDETFERTGIEYQNYFNLGLSLKVYKAIKIIKEMLKPLIVDYNEPLIQEDHDKYKNYLKEKNKNNIERKELGKFPCKDIIAYTFGNESKYDLKIQDIFNFKGIIIYGFLEDENKLKFINKEVYRFKSLKCLSKTIDSKIKVNKYDSFEYNSLNPQAIKIIRIAKNNEKYFKKNNMIHIDKFNSDNKIFRKLATTYLIEDTLKEIIKFQSHHQNNYIVEKIKEINTIIGEHLDSLFQYSDNNKIVLPSMSVNIPIFNEFRQEILTIAKENNWFDNSIMFKLKEIEYWFKGIEILKFVDLNEKSMPVVLKYLFDNKKKLNYEYYAKYVKPEIFENQLIIDFDVKEQEETETKLFKIIRDVA